MLTILRDLTWLTAWHTWRGLRSMSGDDAYDRYCAALIAAGCEEQPLSRAQFFQRHIELKWNRYSQLGR